MTVIICIDCRRETRYLGVGQYCCPHCHNAFRDRWNPTTTQPAKPRMRQPKPATA